MVKKWASNENIKKLYLKVLPTTGNKGTKDLIVLNKAIDKLFKTVCIKKRYVFVISQE
nr:hypothetical protein [Borreliella japonica]WKC87709.1 hypothetical protein QIA21_00615 [Borreliella japonica]